MPLLAVGILIKRPRQFPFKQHSGTPTTLFNRSCHAVANPTSGLDQSRLFNAIFIHWMLLKRHMIH